MSKNSLKKPLKKHFKVLEMIKNKYDLYEIENRFGATEEDIKIWRKTILGFEDEYLKAIGLTSVQEKFIEQFPIKMLNVAVTCRTVGISRQTYYRWYQNSDTFATFLHNIIEEFKDNVESILLRKVFVEKNNRALFFYCKTKMADRGYGERKVIFIQNNINSISINKYENWTDAEIDAEIARLEEKNRLKN